MRKRAEQADQTRQRIVEAAVHLHGTVGPAATTIAGIAEQAGVTRLTVYRHFPDEVALYLACTCTGCPQVPPRPRRLGKARRSRRPPTRRLADLCRYYRQGQAMLTRTYRDLAALPGRCSGRRKASTATTVTCCWSPCRHLHRAQQRRLRAVLGHAVSFWTWRSLCLQGGLSNREAVEAMATLALATATGPAPIPRYT